MGRHAKAYTDNLQNKLDYFIGQAYQKGIVDEEAINEYIANNYRNDGDYLDFENPIRDPFAQAREVFQPLETSIGDGAASANKKVRGWGAEKWAAAWAWIRGKAANKAAEEQAEEPEEPQKEESRGPLSGHFAITDGYRDPGHPGIDMGARNANGKRNYDDANPPAIYFLTDGKIKRITYAESENDAGNAITYTPTGFDNYEIITMHMRDNPQYEEGQRITEGSESGDMGNTGNSSGPHLHLEIRKGDKDSDYIDIDPRDAPFWDDQWLEKELPYQ